MKKHYKTIIVLLIIVLSSMTWRFYQENVRLKKELVKREAYTIYTLDLHIIGERNLLSYLRENQVLEKEALITYYATLKQYQNIFGVLTGGASRNLEEHIYTILITLEDMINDEVIRVEKREALLAYVEALHNALQEIYETKEFGFTIDWYDYIRSGTFDEEMEKIEVIPDML